MNNLSIRSIRRSIAAAMAAALCSVPAAAQEKPTMGWSSWNTFALNISESIIKNQAAAMKKQGLLKAGYNHINIDDGYFGGRDPETGQLLIHPTRFPNGLLPVVKYIHLLGMKAGIYSDAGHNTCGNYHGGDKLGEGVGLYEHDQQDCDFFFKECGFDFIKVDFCGGVDYHNSEKLNLDEKERYTAIAKAIANTGRTDVRMNICRWAYPGTWASDIAASWRTTGDINCSWGSVKSILEENMYMSAYCHDGHFNDMDMLEVGRTLSKEEDRTHFGMWCIMSSPLLIGCDMSTLKTDALNLLRNKDLIALNQDTLCIQAHVVQHKNDTYVLTKDLYQLHGNTRAVALYNPTDAAVDMSIDFIDLDLEGTVEVRDLYEQKDLGTMTGTLAARVPAHGTRIYRLTAERRLERILYEAETAYLSKYQEIKNNQSFKSGIYESNSACSGGMYAGWLGSDPNNDLQWRNVFSDKGGDYTMTIKYLSGEARNITVNVNGEDIKTLSCNSGGWGNVAEKTVSITLQPGENIVRLYNKSASSWMPNIDCMTLKPADGNDRIEVTAITAPQAPIPGTQASSKNAPSDDSYYLIDGRQAETPEEGIYIHKGKKVIF